MTQYPVSLQPESLMQHMQALCKDIGPRPPTSSQEQAAAAYVERSLQRLGVSHLEKQTFKSPSSAGLSNVPCFVAGLLGTLLARLGGRWGKALGGGLLLGSAYVFRQRLLVRPAFFHNLVARGVSQNIVARIPASGPARRTLYLVGHLDSQKQRFQFPTFHPGLTITQTSLPLILGALGGVGLWVEAARNRKGTPRWLWPLSAAYLWGVGGALNDEAQPHIEGANDNATAVSILLGIAQVLQAQPLAHTDVVLLFTGCEEVGCVGMEHYLEHSRPSVDNTFWLDIEMVGTGDLCYITRHGMTPFTHYAPHPEMLALAKSTAQQHPELGVQGKAMLIVDEIANLSHRGHKAICIAGYDAQGQLPNWHRLSDNLEHIEPETLSRAACYVWALMQAMDVEK